ncbi:hypothetical protein OUZ56_016629 [Daphnia magna]|uniref:Uncharacterized protein n=1 Tax=Daphnia magna TaxID=35525 RepID=A0ABR0AR46_9CRUS|nr:hypothetical protein OUZ56_016629 [Daphnia magna]
MKQLKNTVDNTSLKAPTSQTWEQDIRYLFAYSQQVGILPRSEAIGSFGQSALVAFFGRLHDGGLLE